MAKALTTKVRLRSALYSSTMPSMCSPISFLARARVTALCAVLSLLSAAPSVAVMVIDTVAIIWYSQQNFKQRTPLQSIFCTTVQYNQSDAFTILQYTCTVRRNDVSYCTGNCVIPVQCTVLPVHTVQYVDRNKSIHSSSQSHSAEIFCCQLLAGQSLGSKVHRWTHFAAAATQQQQK